MRSVLIDTDVILDYFFDRTPFSNHATEILIRCESGELQGYVTPVIISNLYYLLRRSGSHEKVIRSISKLLKIVDILTTDKNCVLQAINSDFKDFEDALQYFSALRSDNIHAILTRNIKDYKKSSIAVMTPEEFLAV